MKENKYDDNIFFQKYSQMGASDKPCGMATLRLTQYRTQTIHEERYI